MFCSVYKKSVYSVYQADKRLRNISSFKILYYHIFKVYEIL